MKRKLVLGFIIYSLLFMMFSVVAVEEVSAQKKPPKKARKLKRAGDRLFNRRDYRGAIGKYAEAVIIAGDYADAHFWKGYSHFKLFEIRARQGAAGYESELDLALDEINAAYRYGYKPLDVYMVRWYLNYLKGNYQAALEDINRGLAMEPENLTFRAGKADVLYKKKDYGQAVAAYINVVDRIPNNGDAWHNIAQSHYELGNTAEQKLAAEKAIANRTSLIGESYFLIGDALQRQRRLDEAIDAYQKSLSAKQDKIEVYQNLSDIYRTQNNFEKAIETIKMGLRVFPGRGELYVDLSWYQSLADKHKDAVGSAQRAVALLPDYFMGYTNMCRGYIGLKEFKLAIQACDRALKLSPGDGETNFYLGYAYGGLKDAAKSKDFYRKSIPGLIKYAQERPYYADAFYLLGNAYYYNDQNDKAIAAFERSLVLSPKFTKAIYNLGIAYAFGNKLEKAREQYQKLLELDPEEARRLKIELDKFQ